MESAELAAHLLRTCGTSTEAAALVHDLRTGTLFALACLLGRAAERDLVLLIEAELKSRPPWPPAC